MSEAEGEGRARREGMRIATKMTLAFVSAGILLFGGHGLILLSMERHDLQAAASREMEKLGHLLQAAVESALRDRQVEDILEAVERLEEVDHRVTIRVSDTEGRIIAPVDYVAGDPLDEDLLRRALMTRESLLRFHPADDPDVLLFASPLFADDGALVGGLVVRRPLEEMQRDIITTTRGISLTVLLFVATITVIGFSLGSSYIGRPLRRLAGAMARVRGGDYGTPLLVERDDEVGELAQAFNAMLRDLQEARQRLMAEAEARRELQRAVQQADKLITLGQLSAGLAHEIGSPLQILQGRAGALVEKADDAARTERTAKIMVEQCERITRIVERLMHLARRRPAELGPVDVYATARSVLDLLEVEARRRGVKLVLTGEAQVLPAADADGIQQLIFNLVSNALWASAGGEVRVSVTPGRQAMPPVGEERAVVCLRVEDDGEGIAAEVAARIFEPFFTTRSDEGGTGLGLAVVKTLVDEHRGHIAVEQPEAGGSAFVVSL